MANTLINVASLWGAVMWVSSNPKPRVFKAENSVSRVMPKSGVLTPESSGDQIDVCYLNTVFELYSSYHLGQVIEAA